MHSQLHEILKYKNEAVVTRFKKEHPDKASRAEDIFADLLRFFWGTHKHNEDRLEQPNNEALNFVFIMDDDMREIDQMWHIFLLYTRDYMSFCQEYFGQYLHHQPDLVPLFERQGFEFTSNLRKFLNYNYAIFGEAVLRRWFVKSLDNANHSQ